MASYSTGTFDCFSDLNICCCVYCCFPCEICKLANKIGAEDTHGPAQVWKMICASECLLCALCCCPENIWCCFMTSLYKKSMAKHNITTPLPPCGSSECCGMYCQICFCASCTMCAMVREAKRLTYTQ